MKTFKEFLNEERVDEVKKNSESSHSTEHDSTVSVYSNLQIYPTLNTSSSKALRNVSQNFNKAKTFVEIEQMKISKIAGDNSEKKAAWNKLQKDVMDVASVHSQKLASEIERIETQYIKSIADAISKADTAMLSDIKKRI